MMLLLTAVVLASPVPPDQLTLEPGPGGPYVELVERDGSVLWKGNWPMSTEVQLRYGGETVSLDPSKLRVQAYIDGRTLRVSTPSPVPVNVRVLVFARGSTVGIPEWWLSAPTDVLEIEVGSSCAECELPSDVSVVEVVGPANACTVMVPCSETGCTSGGSPTVGEIVPSFAVPIISLGRPSRRRS